MSDRAPLTVNPALYCDSDWVSLKSLGILTMINGRELDGNSRRRQPVESVYSH